MHHRDTHHNTHSHRGRRFARGDHRHADSDTASRSDSHWGRGRHGRGGRPNDLDLRRFFAHGDLRLVILRLIAEKPRHGYEIIKEIEERVGGAYSPSRGVIYPTLTLLEEEGFATVAAADGNKKLYAATEQGKECLNANRVVLKAIFGRMEQAGKVFGRGRSPQIKRAIMNLKFALKMRVERGDLKPDPKHITDLRLN